MRKGDADYRRSSEVLSAWACVEGWTLESCFRDPMRALFLGTVRDLYASALAFWWRSNFLGGDGTMSEKLRSVSDRLRRESHQAK